MKMLLIFSVFRERSSARLRGQTLPDRGIASPQEQLVIEHPHSCYVLGRSGTGCGNMC